MNERTPETQVVIDGIRFSERVWRQAQDIMHEGAEEYPRWAEDGGATVTERGSKGDADQWAADALREWFEQEDPIDYEAHPIYSNLLHCTFERVDWAEVVRSLGVVSRS